MAEFVTQTFIEFPNKPGRIKQGFVIVFRSDRYCNKDSLLTISLTTSELALEANEPIIALTTQAVFALSTWNHEPLTRYVPGTESQGRLSNIRAISTRVFLVEIAPIAYPYGRRTGH